MNIIPHLFIPLSIGVVIFIIAFFKWTKWAVAGLIIAKPIIDLTWGYNVMGDINFLKIYAGLFVILGLIYVLYHRVNVTHTIIHKLWIVFLCLNFVSIFIIAGYVSFIDKIDYYLRILSGFMALILFARLFDFEKEQKKVLAIFISASIFPILMWLVPIIFNIQVYSNDYLGRIIGPYHDFKIFSFYGLQAITCCIAYVTIINAKKLKNNQKNENTIFNIGGQKRLVLRKTPKLLLTIVLWITIIISTLAILTCYSKSALIVLSTWSILSILFMKKYLISLLLSFSLSKQLLLNLFFYFMWKHLINFTLRQFN